MPYLKDVYLVHYVRSAFSRSRPSQPERDVFNTIRMDEVLSRLIMHAVSSNSIGELHSFLPTSHYVYSAYKNYRYAFIILPHNSTLSGFSSVLGYSFAVSILGHYVYIIFSDFGGMNTARLSNLVDLQTNTMTSGPLI